MVSLAGEGADRHRQRQADMDRQIEHPCITVSVLVSGLTALPFHSTFPSQFLLTAMKLDLLSWLNVSHLNFLDAFLPLSKG